MEQLELRTSVIKSAIDESLTLGKVKFKSEGLFLFIDIDSITGKFIESLDLPESSEWCTSVPSSDKGVLSEGCNVRIVITFEERIEK